MERAFQIEENMKAECGICYESVYDKVNGERKKNNFKFTIQNCRFVPGINYSLILFYNGLGIGERPTFWNTVRLQALILFELHSHLEEKQYSIQKVMQALHVYDLNVYDYMPFIHHHLLKFLHQSYSILQINKFIIII